MLSMALDPFAEADQYENQNIRPVMQLHRGACCIFAYLPYLLRGV